MNETLEDVLEDLDEAQSLESSAEVKGFVNNESSDISESPEPDKDPEEAAEMPVKPEVHEISGKVEKIGTGSKTLTGPKTIISSRSK